MTTGSRMAEVMKNISPSGQPCELVE